MRLWQLTILALLSVANCAALAQLGEIGQRQVDLYQRQQSIEAEKAVPVQQRALVDYGGYLIPSYISLDDATGNNHVFWEYDLYGYARIEPAPNQQFFFLGQLTLQDFNTGDNFHNSGDEYQDWRIDRLFYRVASPNGEDSAHSTLALQGGRQLIYWGNGLTLAETLDAGRVDLTTGAINAQLIAGITPRDTVDFDISRPAFDSDTIRGFYGIYAEKSGTWFRPYVYGLMQRDYDSSRELRTDGISTRFNYNSNYLGAGSRGSIGDRMTYSTETVLEFGSGLSNSFELVGGTPEAVPQKHEEILACAADLQANYLLLDSRKSKITGEFIAASGDHDRLNTNDTFGGNQAGTQDHAFNAYGLVNTGLAFAPPVSNLLMGRLGFSTFPRPHGWTERLQIGVDMFVYAKLLRSGAINQTTDDNRMLGFEPDVFLNWQLTEDLTLSARYGIFIPGSAIPDDSQRQAIYISATYAF